MTNATEIVAALHKRWPDGEYIKIEEAPTGADRMGRKIDLLALSVWSSRGFEIDAVEIKISLSDWKRELDEPGKADWWWNHSHRFWLAVPIDLAEKVRPDLPSTWGLLGVNENGTQAVVKAPKHKANPLPWSACLGLLRASANAGLNALFRARMAGVEEGIERGKKSVERVNGDSRLQQELEGIKGKIIAFEAASGVNIDTWNNEKIGNAVKLVLESGQPLVFERAKSLRDKLNELLEIANRE